MEQNTTDFLDKCNVNGFSLNPRSQKSKIKASTGLCPYKGSVGGLIPSLFQLLVAVSLPRFVTSPSHCLLLRSVCNLSFIYVNFLFPRFSSGHLWWPSCPTHIIQDISKILNLISPAKAFLQIREKEIQSRDQDIDTSVGRGACQSTAEVEAHWRIKRWQFASSELTDPPQYPLKRPKCKLAGTKYWAFNIEKAAGAKTITLPANEVWGCV